MKKVLLILCTILSILAISVGKTDAQIDSTSKKSFGFVELNGGLSIPISYLPPNAVHDGYDLRLAGGIPLKHSHFGLGGYVSYGRNYIDTYSLNQVGLTTTIHGVDYISFFNAQAGIFYQLPFFHTGGTIRLELLGGVVNLKTPEFGWNDTTYNKHPISSNWGSYFGADVAKTNTTAFSTSFSAGIVFPIGQHLITGINFLLLYSNLNGLKTYPQYTYPYPYPPEVIILENTYNLMYSVISLTIGLKID